MSVPATTGPELSRRQVYAFIALTDLPMPKQIHFRRPWADGRTAMTLIFDNSADLLAWTRLLSDADDAQLSKGILVADDTEIAYTEYVDWGGYHIMLQGDDPIATDPAVDDATRERLEQLVDGPAAAEGGDRA
jgi:hypothetical protein